MTATQVSDQDNNKIVVEALITEAMFAPFCASAAKYHPCEEMAFTFMRVIKVPGRILLIAETLCLLDDTEAVRTPTSVTPTPGATLAIYGTYFDAELHKADVVVATWHTHPFQDAAGLSGIDFATMADDRERLGKLVDGGVPFAWLVLGAGCQSFDGRFVTADAMIEVDELTVVGSTIFKVRCGRGHHGRQHGRVLHGDDADRVRDLHDRQQRIPGWNQDCLRMASLGLVGLGGLGGTTLVALTLMGIGEDRELVLVDPDLVEATNLSRLPYATPTDIGRPKVEVAKAWVERMRPGRSVRAVHRDLLAPEAQAAVVSCDVMIGATDSDLARHCLNHLCSAFLRPLIDAGSGVRADEIAGRFVVTVGGQVRLFAPGGVCLMCNMGLDAERIRRELSVHRTRENPALAAALEHAGYLQGNAKDGLPEPAATHINMAVAASLVTVLLSYLHGQLALGDCGRLVDLSTPGLHSLTAQPNPDCSYCGNQDQLASGTFYVPEGANIVVPQPPANTQGPGASLLALRPDAEGHEP